MDRNLAEAVLARLEKAKGPDSKGNYTALCPFHHDTEPSLSFHPDKGAYFCFSCGAKGIARALAEKLGIAGGPLTLEQLAEAKGLPLDWLKKVAHQGKNGVEIPYRDEDGQEAAIRHRVALVDTETTKRFYWRKGDKLCLYGLFGLEAQKRKGFTVLVEGESDPWTLWYSGFPALGVPGAASWQKEWARHLKGFGKVYAWKEPDRGGETFIRKLAADLPDLLVIEAPVGAKDPSELYLSDPSNFRQAFGRLLAAARPAKDVIAELEDKGWRANLEKAKPLLEDPLVLARVVQAAEAQGVVGERKNLALVYLALASRGLARPLNTGVSGPPSGGKSFLVNTIVGLHALEAVFTLTSGSERSLAFTEESFKGKFVYFQEAKGTHPGDVSQAILHELAWGNRIRYQFVDKTAKGLVSLLIEKEGPTGLLLTTTRPLGPEMETRLLTIAVNDTPAQNAAVLAAIAARRTDTGSEAIDLAPFHALSRVLARPARVNILWGLWLAEQVPHRAVRIRRAFELFLSLVEASALLHQAHRPRTDRGEIVASVTDYAVALTLAGESLLDTEREGITPGQREAIEAVRSLYEKAKESGDPKGADLGQVAEQLGICREAARQRLAHPLALGFVVNNEERKGRPASYVPGAAVKEVSALPTPEALAREFPNLADDWPPLVNFLVGKDDVFPPPNDLDTLTVKQDSYLGTVKVSRSKMRGCHPMFWRCERGST